MASSLKENEVKIPGGLNTLFTSLNKIRESMIEGNGTKFIDLNHELREKIINLTTERGNIYNITWIKKFNDTTTKIHEDYKNLANCTGDSILHALINKTILLYTELRDKIEKNKELLNGTIYNLTKALIDINNINTTPLEDQLNETLDKNRENFIGELIKLCEFGIKIRDKLDNLKN